MRTPSKTSFEQHEIGWKTHTLVICASWFFLFWCIPFYDGLPGAVALDPPNEKTRVMGMASIGLFEELHINRVRDSLWWTRRTDLSGRKRTKSDGKKAPKLLMYPSKTPGLPMLLGGLYWVYRHYVSDEPPTLFRATYFARLFGTLLPTWLASLLFYFLLLQICRTRFLILTGHFVFLLGTTMFPYALTLGSHSFAGGMLLLSFVSLWWCPRNIWLRLLSGILAGLGIGLAFSAEYTAVFTGVWLGLFALFRRPPTPASFAAKPLPTGWRYALLWMGMRWHLLVALLASLLPVGAVLWFHKQAFGSMWKTPYDFMLNESFRRGLARGGFLGYLWPPDPENIALLLFSPATGLFFWTPFFCFSFVGIYFLFRKRMHSFLWPFLGLFFWWMMYPGMLYNPRGGWSVGPRYIANIVPFAMLLSVWGAEKLYMKYGNRVVPLIAFSAVWSILHYVPSSVLFPHLPTKSFMPQVDIVLPMIQRGLAPSFLFPLSVGWAMFWYGLALFALCSYLLLFGSKGKQRWWNRVLTFLLLVFGVLMLFQLPVRDYVRIDKDIRFIERYIPPSARWKW